MNAPARIAFSAMIVIGLMGCVKEVKDVKEIESSKGLTAVPYLPPGTAAFSSTGAEKLSQTDEEAAKQAIQKRVEEMAQQKGEKPKIFDPWIPPDDIKSEKLYKALRILPKDKYGYPDWSAAVTKGVIKPRDSIGPVAPKAEAEPKSIKPFVDASGKEIPIPEGRKEAQKQEQLEEGVFDADIIFEINDRLMFNVKFPHKAHTYWLSCKICHPGIFIPKKGANQFTMYDIWDGKYCGRCHGNVAFQPKGFNNCQRCHSSRKKTMGVR
ncbi:MAG: cytochrome c3 family protein [Deltaproteobacteria bacterium]|nr:cytochrome c3 family protein [Deltaproteobacteria bacterium]